MVKFINKLKRFISIRFYFKRLLLPKIMKEGVFLTQCEELNSIKQVTLIEEKRDRLKSFEELVPVSRKKMDNRFLSSHAYQNRDKYLYEISDAYLTGPFGLISLNDGRLVRDTISFNGTGRVGAFLLQSYIDHPGMLKRNLRIKPKKAENQKTKTIDTGLSMCSVWVNYFHWIMEELPKLRALELYQRMTGQRPVIIIPNHTAAYIKESLKVMGFDPEKCCVVYHSELIQVRKLVVQTFPEITPEMVSWMRNRVFQNLGLSTSASISRIYISRKNKGNRSVKNADEFSSLLQKFGFNKVQLEEYSFEEQVQLLNQASVVISAHGAGLTNILWGNQLKVIELFGYTIKTTYARLCDACGHDYRAIAGEPIEKNHRADFIIDIGEIEVTLASLGIEPVKAK